MAGNDLNEKIRKEEAMLTKNLPEDIILAILSRLPVKSLLRFRSVSKLWCALITDPDFVQMHLYRSLATNTNLILLVIREYLKIFYSDVCEQETAVELDCPFKSPVGFLILASCNGLLCLFDDDGVVSYFPKEEVYDTFLWNPSTRTHKKLPFTPVEFPINSDSAHVTAYGFGYDPTTDDYKVIRVLQFYPHDGLFNDSKYIVSEVKVYSLSTNSWRRIEDIPFLSIEHRLGVFTNSAFHWVVYRKTGVMGSNTAPNVIVSIDVKDDVYREVPLPDFVDDKFHMTIGVLGGQLSILCNFSKVCVELWVMKDYGVRDSWEKQFSIEQPLVLGYFDECIRPICYSRKGEVLLETGPGVEKCSGALVLYDPHKGRASNLTPRDSCHIVSIGSLISLDAKDGAEYEKKEETEVIW
ncbi:F-box protein CPR1-like [Telopea speciosissima]|uniref:F-box protein CPR1-like n=1 Tax=Telopea speciosissima TaxID=54955 RepID=UPI001CC63582|nr:F-box protein CPR1-like [Telopea speciosissima]